MDLPSVSTGNTRTPGNGVGEGGKGDGVGVAVGGMGEDVIVGAMVAVGAGACVSVAAELQADRTNRQIIMVSEIPFRLFMSYSFHLMLCSGGEDRSSPIHHVCMF